MMGRGVSLSAFNVSPALLRFTYLNYKEVLNNEDKGINTNDN